MSAKREDFSEPDLRLSRSTSAERLRLFGPAPKKKTTLRLSLRVGEKVYHSPVSHRLTALCGGEAANGLPQCVAAADSVRVPTSVGYFRD